MSYIVDRRLNAKNKSTVNRQRFLERYKKHIKKAVSDAVDSRSITDMERGEEVTIPADDVSEPIFHHGQGGSRSIVHPGNKEFVQGDRIARPQGGAGSGGGEGEASDSGEGEDDFVFQLSQDEFLEFLFDGLALPNLSKRALKGDASFKYEHAGFTTDGVPAKLSVLRSLKAAKARRIALSGESKRLLKVAQAELEKAAAEGDEVGKRRLEIEIEQLEQIMLVVRDKNTGLLLTRERQRRNVDYTVKYPEGRITFRRWTKDLPRKLEGPALEDAREDLAAFLNNPCCVSIHTLQTRILL